MKHIKTYENTIGKPKLGDYVICSENANYDMHEFISKNIGKIVLTVYQPTNTVKYDYLVQYNNIPENLNIYFEDYGASNARPMDIDEITEFSENRENLEFVLNANKYNL